MEKKKALNFGRSGGGAVAIESAASRVCREGGARVPTNVTWIWPCQLPRADAEWRSSQMASSCSAACSLLWMPPSFVRCTATERPVLVPPVWMVQHWQSHADGKDAQSTVGCVGWRGRRSMVCGEQHFRVTPCKSKSAIRAKCHETRAPVERMAPSRTLMRWCMISATRLSGLSVLVGRLTDSS